MRYKAIDLFNQKLGLEISYEEVDKHQNLSIHHAFGMTDELRKEIWKDLIHDIYRFCEPLPHSIELLNEWKKSGHDIYYITARRDTKAIKFITIEWLKQYGFPFHEKNFYIGMRDEEKVWTAKQLQLDLFFEDKPVVIEQFIHHSMNFIIKDQSYNRHFLHTRIHNWSKATLIY